MLGDNADENFWEVGQKGLTLGELFENVSQEGDSGAGLGFLFEFAELDSFQKGGHHEAFSFWSEVRSELC